MFILDLECNVRIELLLDWMLVNLVSMYTSIFLQIWLDVLHIVGIFLVENVIGSLGY